MDEYKDIMFCETKNESNEIVWKMWKLWIFIYFLL